MVNYAGIDANKTAQEMFYLGYKEQIYFIGISHDNRHHIMAMASTNIDILLFRLSSLPKLDSRLHWSLPNLDLYRPLPRRMR